MPVRSAGQLRLLAQLGGLWALGVQQPLFATLSENPAFFVAHHASPGEIVALAALLSIAVPVALWAVVSAIGWAAPAFAGPVRFVSCYVLLVVLVAQLVDAVVHWAVAGAVAIVAAGTAMMVLERSPGMRRVLTLLGVAPLLFFGLFVFASPVTDLVFPDEVEAVRAEDLVTIPPTTAASQATPDAAVETDPIALLRERFPSIFVIVLDEFPAASALDASGSVHRELFPNLAALSDRSHFFRDVTTPASHTPFAVPSLLTGRAPDVTAAPTYTAHPQNLFTLLGGVYDARSTSDIVDMCAPTICDGASPIDLVEAPVDSAPSTATVSADADTVSSAPDRATTPGFSLLLRDTMTVLGHTIVPAGLDIGLAPLDQGFTDFGGAPDFDPDAESPTTTTTTTIPVALDESVSTTTFAPTLEVDVGERSENLDDFLLGLERIEFLENLRVTDRRVDNFVQWVADIDDTGVPQLDVHHVLLPHVPWRYLPDGAVYQDLATPGYADPQGWPDNASAATARQRHLLQLSFADQLLGGFLARLDEVGLADDALIVITADHGVSFEPGTKPRDPATAADPIASVPLWIHEPGQTTGEVHDRPATLLDVLPTIAELVGVEIPWEIDGSSLFTGSAATERSIVSPEGTFAVSTPGLAATLDSAAATAGSFGASPYHLDPTLQTAEVGAVPSTYCFEADVDAARLVHGALRGATRSIEVGVVVDDELVASGWTATHDDAQLVQLLTPTRGQLVEVRDPLRRISACG